MMACMERRPRMDVYRRGRGDFLHSPKDGGTGEMFRVGCRSNSGRRARSSAANGGPMPCLDLYRRATLTLVSIAVAIFCASVSPPSAAQWVGYATGGVPRKADGAVDMAAA